MKILKYFLGFLALLALIFFGRGLLTPNVSYSSEITVNKPIKEAWAVMNDESKLDQWLKGMTKMEHISGTKSTVGAVTEYTYSENGQESVIRETITSISPNEHIAMDFLMEGVMEMDYRVDFSEKDGKTSIKSATTTTGLGIMMKSLVSFMKGSMQTQEDVNMNNLKVLIEGNTTDYFPVVVEEPVLEGEE